MISIENSYKPLYNYFKNIFEKPKETIFPVLPLKSKDVNRKSAEEYFEKDVKINVKIIVDHLNLLLDSIIPGELSGINIKNHLKNIKTSYNLIQQTINTNSDINTVKYIEFLYNKSFLMKPIDYLSTKTVDIDYNNLANDRKNKFRNYLENQKTKIIEYVKDLFYMYLSAYFGFPLKSTVYLYLKLNDIDNYFNNSDEYLRFNETNFYQSVNKSSEPILQPYVSPLSQPISGLSLSPKSQTISSTPNYMLNLPPSRPSSPTPSYLRPTESSTLKARPPSPTNTGRPFY
jgi:hypothetical protein